MTRRRAGFTETGGLLLLFLLAGPGCTNREGASAGPAEEDPAARQEVASGSARIPFRTHEIADTAQGGLVAVRFSLPVPWKASGEIRWRYEDTQMPVRASARVASPDGSTWVEAFPALSFYSLEPDVDTTPVGGVALGSIRMPLLPVADAMRRFVIEPQRGDRESLRIVGSRPILNLPQAMGEEAAPGEGVAIRLTWTEGGEPVEEEFYAWLTRQSVPYHGPMGTTVQHNWWLTLIHSMGARGGHLEASKPLLGWIAKSFTVDPFWLERVRQVRQEIDAEFQRMIAAGYAQIQAAAELSRQISAHSDAVLGMVEQQRLESNHRLEAMRSGGASDAADEFSQYIRGGERKEDPYWGTSEHAYDQRYHWTDGFGNYRHSNDPGYDPNIGSNQTWTRME